MIDRVSAQWAYQLGAQHMHQPEPQKLCIFHVGSDHARYWRLGWSGRPFVFGGDS